MKRPSTHLCSLFVSLAACILGCAPAADHALDIPADEAWTFLSIEGMQCADGSR